MRTAIITSNRGFTLIELTIAIVISSIIILGVGGVLVDSHRGWQKMYSRTFSEVKEEGKVARLMFDTVIRKASESNIQVGLDNDWVEVQYYDNGASESLDRYARFYKVDDELQVEYGTLDPKAATSTQTVCSNVTSCVFMNAGSSVQMILSLDNDSEHSTILTSATPHN